MESDLKKATGTGSAPRSRRTLLIAGSLYAAAVLVRLAFVFQSHNLPDFRTPTPGLDTCVQWQAARQVVKGAPDPCFELMLPSAPFHVYFLAANQAILGNDILTHRLFRAFLCPLSVVILFLAARRLTNRTVPSLLAAAVVAGLPSWIYHDTVVEKVSIEILLLSTALWMLVRMPSSSSWPRLLGFGALLGIIFSVLRFSQGATVFYTVAAAVYVLLHRPLAFRRRLAIAAPIVLLVVSSQLAFKYREPLFHVPANRFLPVGGVHMRIGFQPGAIGTYHVIQRFPALPLGHTFFSRMAAEAMHGRQMTPKEADRSYVREATDFIKENPKEARDIVLRKLGIFFNTFEPAGNHYLAHVKQRAPILKIATIGFGGLTILAFWGVIALWRERRRLLLMLLLGMLVGVLIPNIVGFVTWRYRLHATVPMVILAAFGLLFLSGELRRFVHAVRARSSTSAWARIVAVCLLTGLIAYCAFRPVLVMARTFMGTTADKNLSQSESAEKFNKQIAEIEKLRPLSARQGLLLSTLYHCVGRYTDSYVELKHITATEPEELGASRQFLVYLMWYGDYDGAVAFMKRLIRERPRAFEALLRSFESDATFWGESDLSLKLIVQALMRDIVLPRLSKEVFGDEIVTPGPG